MGLTRRLSLLLLVLIAGCSTVAYRWYAPNLPAECYEAGTLQGPEEKDDLPMKDCLSGSGGQVVCSVVFNAELRRMLDRIAALEQQLKACEENHK